MPHAFIVEDREYLRHGDRPLLARLFRPEADGPFPAVIDVHGGAWTSGDRTECQARGEALAAAGLLVAALDFRHAADGYPSSLIDINYATRWLKAHAREFGAAPDWIGITGNSSGGHLAMLSAMRPHDPRYASVPLAGYDAAVQCVVMLWPVINPLSRYRYARRVRDAAKPPAWVGNIPERHDTYWKTEAAMAEGNPMLALERDERVETPPALWIQGRPDPVHDYRDADSSFAGNEPDRFVDNYRRAGGQIELTYVDQESRSSAPTYDLMVSFFRRHR
jgi:acetyl esterase